jgi:2-phosphoglycerate kinase
MQTTIIIFTGLPGTGKSTLSRQVADVLNVPLIAKDAIKEIMYDNIGWSDKGFSDKLAHATFGIMDYITEQNLKNGRSMILESNYSPKLANEIFQEWQKVYGCKIIQIVCRTDINILARRYLDRQHTNRHPGHIDTGTIEEYKINFRQRIENGEDQPLNTEGLVRVVNTTNFRTVNAQEIANWIGSNIASHKFRTGTLGQTQN